MAIYLSALGAAAKRFGIDYKGKITVPSSAPDLAPYVDEAASKGAQCIETLAVGPQAISALKALVPLAQEGKFDKTIICTACLSIPGTASAETPLINALGNHIILLGASDPPNDTANPVVVRWVHDQSAYNVAKTPDLEAVSGTNWVNLQLIVRAANAVYPNVTSSNILHYLNHLSSFWPGLYPTGVLQPSHPQPLRAAGLRSLGGRLRLDAQRPEPAPHLAVRLGPQRPDQQQPGPGQLQRQRQLRIARPGGRSSSAAGGYVGLVPDRGTMCSGTKAKSLKAVNLCRDALCLIPRLRERSKYSGRASEGGSFVGVEPDPDGADPPEDGLT